MERPDGQRAGHVWRNAFGVWLAWITAAVLGIAGGAQVGEWVAVVRDLMEGAGGG